MSKQMYLSGNSINNLLSYCGLVDAKIRASDKDLPVTGPELFSAVSYSKPALM